MSLFSVMIPTLNRAHRLNDALQSVVAQDFGDYEIIVSDDCSSDNTRDVVRKFQDARIHYVRPASHLLMHDHWEFLRKHARGDYLLLLADDDCLVKNALSTLAQLVRSGMPSIVGFGNIEYYSNDYWVRALRNHIHIGQFTGEIISIDSRTALYECFQLNPLPHYYPRASALIARSLVESIAAEVGRFFDYPNPEYVGFAMAYSMIEHYLFIDKPLIVLGRTPESLGPRYFWSNQDPSWRETTGEPFAFVPLKGTFMTNGAAESFLRAKNNLPARFEGIELSLANYYRGYYADMVTQRGLGRNIQRELEEWYRAIELLTPMLRDQVRSSIKSLDVHAPLWYRLSRRVRSYLTRARDIVSNGKRSEGNDNQNGQWIDGAKIGVSNILSCAEWIEGQDTHASLSLYHNP